MLPREELLCGLGVIVDRGGLTLVLLVDVGALFAFKGEGDFVGVFVIAESDIERNAVMASFFAFSAALCFSLFWRNLGSFGLDLEVLDEEKSISQATPS